ncbi:hypothetical protein [Nitrospina gracilis]|uniref:hypothetical protein n=1 Tax=Nitrospina gracilis TaxID=35801 RepID=UPI001F485809|nr:hypothetical protein [Nitrospina gracilis]MCF8719232.1 hypothetical protein [Nitrospina gracilis Nb-211]
MRWNSDCTFQALFIFAILLVPFWETGDAISQPESEYNRVFCDQHGGVMEYVVDGGRVDCLIPGRYAVEVERAHKWAEAVGQSKFYSIRTGETPGIALIILSDKDWKYLVRLLETIQHDNPLPAVWVISNSTLSSGK